MKLYVLKFNTSCPEGDGGDKWFGIFTTKQKAEAALVKLHAARWRRQDGSVFGYHECKYCGEEHEIEEWETDEFEVPFADESGFIGYAGEPTL